MKDGIYKFLYLGPSIELYLFLFFVFLFFVFGLDSICLTCVNKEKGEEALPQNKVVDIMC